MLKQLKFDYSKIYLEAQKEICKGRNVDEVIVEYSKKVPLCKTPSDQRRLIKAVKNLERRKLAKNETFELSQQVQQYKRFVRLLQFENQRFRRKYYSLKTILHEKTKILVESSSEEESDVSESETKKSDNDSDNSNYYEE